MLGRHFDAYEGHKFIVPSRAGSFTAELVPMALLLQMNHAFDRASSNVPTFAVIARSYMLHVASSSHIRVNSLY